MNPALLKKLEREHHIPVTEIYFESGDDRNQLISTAPKKLLSDEFISNSNKNIPEKLELTKKLPADTLKDINFITIDIIRQGHCLESQE